MNGQADIRCPIQEELDYQWHKQQDGAVTRQQIGCTSTIETICQLNDALRNLANLLRDYYRRKSSIGFKDNMDSVLGAPYR